MRGQPIKPVYVAPPRVERDVFEDDVKWWPVWFVGALCVVLFVLDRTIFRR